MKNVVRTVKDYSLYLGVSALALGFTACSDDDDGDLIPDVDARISAEDQTIEGNTLVVSEVEVDDDGFIVVHRGSSSGEIVAEPYFLDDDLSPFTDVEITINNDANLQNGETLVIMLYEDRNDNDTYDDGVDLPFQDINNTDVSATITISVEQNEVFGVTNQVLSHNQIRIDRVTVDEAGWLVARNTGSEDDADIVSDPVYLESGENTDIVLNLNDAATLSGTEEGDDIVLMIHTDDGDEEYLYDGETGDQLWVDDEGNPVSYSVNVTAPSISAEDAQSITENNEVTFTNVNTGANSWVVLYGEGDDGEVDWNTPIGYQYVEAGSSEDVLVPFNDDYAFESGQQVYSRLHVDSPADEEFTFTFDGEEDLQEIYGYDDTGAGMYVGNNTTETGGIVVN